MQYEFSLRQVVELVFYAVLFTISITAMITARHNRHTIRKIEDQAVSSVQQAGQLASDMVRASNTRPAA